MEKYEVTLYDISNRTEFGAVVYADEAETSDDIVLKAEFGEMIVTVKSGSYLSAYQKLRDKLLEKGFGLKCKGSLINANQSAMMSYVPKIYLVELGKQAMKKDIVGIWEYSDISKFPDTKGQDSFNEQWFSSLRAKL